MALQLTSRITISLSAGISTGIALAQITLEKLFQVAGVGEWARKEVERENETKRCQSYFGCAGRAQLIGLV